MNEYLAMWKNYFNFKDRTSVRGYWMAVLINIVVAILLVLLSKFSGIFTIVYFLYCLAVLIPGIALSVRRLHDINKSGGWFFIGFVPIVGAILLLIWSCSGSVDEGNRFGTEQV